MEFINPYPIFNRILSPVVAGRAFADMVPSETALPHIRYIQRGGQVVHTGCGAEIGRIEMQVDVSAQTSVERSALVQVVLDGFAADVQSDVRLFEAPECFYDDDIEAFRAVLFFVL